MAFLLIGNLVDRSQLSCSKCINSSEKLGGVVSEDRVGGNFLGGLVSKLLLCLHQRLQEGLSRFQALSNDFLAGLGRASLNQIPAAFGSFCFHHHDGDIFGTVGGFHHTTGYHDVEYGFRKLTVLGERYPLVTNESQTNRSNRTAEGQTGNLSRSTRGIDSQSVIELIRSNRENSNDYLHLVAQTIHERRTQRPVDEATDQDCFGGGTAFTTKERTRDFACCIGAFFHVYRQREKVETFTRVLAGTGCREQHRVLVQVCRDGSLSLLGQTTRFKAHCALTELAVIQNSFGEFNFWTFH